MATIYKIYILEFVADLTFTIFTVYNLILMLHLKYLHFKNKKRPYVYIMHIIQSDTDPKLQFDTDLKFIIFNVLFFISQVLYKPH